MKSISSSKIIASTQNLKIQTQKALKTINQYQKIRLKHFEKSRSIFYRATQLTSKEHETVTDQSIKQFMPKQSVRLQLLPNSCVHYKIQVNKNLQPKLIIKNYRGVASKLWIGYDKMQRQLHNDRSFSLHSQILIKLQKQKMFNSKWLYFTFKNQKNITMFNFRIDLQRTNKRKGLKTERSQGSLLQISTDKFIVLENQNVYLENSLSRIKKQKNRSQSVRLKTITSQDLISAKPQEKKKKIIEFKEIEQKKIIKAKIRKENVQILKLKEIQAGQLSFKCKKLVQQYQSIIQEEQQIKQNIFQQITPIIYMLKFAYISNKLSVNRLEESQRVFMIQLYIQRLKRKMLKLLANKSDMIQQMEQRQKQQLKQNIAFEAFILNKTDKKKSVGVVTNTILNCIGGIVINQSMNQASIYRRYVRTLQRRWRMKYSARTQMLLMYAEQQLKIIFKTYPNLSEIENQYRKRKMAQELCKQYQRDEADKMKQILAAYEVRLEQIEEYKQMNEEIKIYNANSVKKRQKELLQVPRNPARPQPRFFRDLQFFKALIRGWLEVEFRKHKKNQQNSKPKVKEDSYI